ncbi:hypothetical protein ACP70R_020599 [Stipagrostis hirtigluma subsp. patula]
MATSSYLLLDLLLDIAARTDPVTLVRCAATCRDMRRHIADPMFHRHLGLRAPRRPLRPLPPARAPDDTKAPEDRTVLLTAAACSPPRPDGDEPSRSILLKDARDGLLLVRTKDQLGNDDELRVCRPATGRSQVIPPGREFFGRYVLLVGDGEDDSVLGRPFRVLKMCAVESNRHPCLLDQVQTLQVQTFFSEKKAWGPYTQIPIPCVHGVWLIRKPLVAGGAVHWLCRSDTGYCVLKLHYVAGEARVTTTELPASFHLEYSGVFPAEKRLLLATTSPAAGGSLCVVAADSEKISAWVQLEPGSSRWERQTVMENEAMVRFRGAGMPSRVKLRMGTVRLSWFAERSGTVIADTSCGFFELDLQSKEIVRRFHGEWTLFCGVTYHPHEMDLASWVPTFTKTL